MRTDGDFEDREGHQAPFTLPNCDLRFAICDRWQPGTGSLGSDLVDLPNERVEIRPFAGIELGMERFAIGADFEGAAARRHERERRDPIAEVENFSRQTDGLRGVVSNAAILDPDFGFHRSLLSKSEAIGEGSKGQPSRATHGVA
jgi:hypothetical protein